MLSRAFTPEQMMSLDMIKRSSEKELLTIVEEVKQLALISNNEISAVLIDISLFDKLVNEKDNKKNPSNSNIKKKVKSIHTFKINKKDNDFLIRIAQDMVDNELTLRDAEDRYGVPRATLHKRLLKQLPSISPELYDAIKNLLGQRRRQ